MTYGDLRPGDVYHGHNLSKPYALMVVAIQHVEFDMVDITYIPLFGLTDVWKGPKTVDHNRSLEIGPNVDVWRCDVDEV